MNDSLHVKPGVKRKCVCSYAQTLLWLGTLMMMIEFDGDLQYCGFQPHLRAQKSGPFYNRSSVVCPNA